MPFTPTAVTVCPFCYKQFGVPRDQIGSDVECLACGKSFRSSTAAIQIRTLENSLPKTALAVEKCEAICPHCDTLVSYRTEHQGKVVACPKCQGHFRAAVAARAAEIPLAKAVRDDNQIRRPEGAENQAGNICSILSCVFGAISFLCFPPFLGLLVWSLGLLGRA